MSTKKADNKGARKRAAQALNCFPKAVFIKALDALANGKGIIDAANSESESASLTLVRAAADYSEQGHAITDTATVLKDWRENLKALAMELAVAGSPFAKMSEPKDDKPATATLTGTGNNVMSIAKGVVEFEIDVNDCVADDGETTYRSVRTEVEAKRAERKALNDPEGAVLQAAKDECRDQFKALTDVVFPTGDVELIETLTLTLLEMSTGHAADIAEQDKIDAEIAERMAADEAEHAEPDQDDEIDGPEVVAA